MADSKPAVYEAVAASFVEPIAERTRPHRKLIGLLALGHLMIDVNQGALPAVLPLLKSAHALSYAQAATIILVMNVTSSILQPVFGYLSDRTARRWILPAALVMCGAGFAFIGVAPGYLAILALVLVMGLGIAAYHPEGYKAATNVAGDRKATALSWFSLGGNAGIALGPPLSGTLVAVLGLAGTLVIFLPTALVAALILSVLPMLNRASVPRATATSGRGVNRPRAMTLLILVVAVRSWVHLGFMTFVPFYYVDYLHADPRVVGPLLFVFLGAGALGTVIAGPIADRWGPRTFMKWVFLAAIPFGLLFLSTSGIVAVIMLGLFGALLTSSFLVSIVLGQAYLPRNVGMASGLIVGFAIGGGGLGVTALGWIADHHGLPAALWVGALLPLLGFAGARLLPPPLER